MDGRWRIELLGRLRATRGVAVVTRFRARRTGALLAYLAYYLDRPHPRDELIELLWPEAEPHSGRNNLSRELSSLRRQLEPPGVPPGSVILASRDSVQLNPAACTTDVMTFEARLQAPDRATSAAECLVRLTEAAELYRGELLPGYFEAWILPERQRLAEMCLQALAQLASHREEEGDIPGAIQWTRRAAVVDPLREETHEKLIHLLAAAGESAAAIHQYQLLEQLLATKLGAAPDPTLRDFVDSVRARCRATASAGARSSPAAGAQDPTRFRTPLVGRVSELQALWDRWLSARSGHGQSVSVLGAAGIGKSRLVHEFWRRLKGEELTRLEGRCISHGRDIAYLPIIDLLRSHFAVEASDSEAAISARLKAGVEALGSGLVEHLPFVRHLLGVDSGAASVAKMDPPLRKVRLFEALQALLLAMAARRSLVLVVEDLHWIDPLSEEFLASLGQIIPQHPILLLLTARPGYSPRFGSAPALTDFDLQRLSESETAAMARGFLAAEQLPEELQALIYGKARGNPFFVEEVIQSLQEAGVILRSGAEYLLARRIEDVHIPEEVGDVITARLARLTEEPMRAIQTAAVIGSEFTTRLLERTAELQGREEEYLEQLKSVALIAEHTGSAEPGYTFKHALTHAAAYSSVLSARRTELHRLVGTAMEELYHDRLEEQYETLAYHCEQGEAWEKAREYLQRSGDKAMAVFVPTQAVDFYNRALAAAEKSGQALPSETAIALHHSRGQALYLTNDWQGSADSFLRMLQAARVAGDRAQEGVALYRLAYAAQSDYRFADALKYAEQARRLALETNDHIVLACSLVAACAIANTTGDVRKARLASDEALRAGRLSGVPELHGRALYLAGTLAHLHGDEARAVKQFDEGLQVCRRHLISGNLIWHLFGKGLALCSRGEYEPALQSLQEALDLATRLGDRTHRGRVLNSMGWVYMELCHWDLALQYNTQSTVEVRAMGDLRSVHHEVIRNAELNLADCYLALKRFPEARRTLEDVYEATDGGRAWNQEWMQWRYIQHMNASLGELWLALDEPERAFDFADACLAIAHETDSRRYISRGHRVRGEALLALGRHDEAARDLEAALQMAQQLGNPPHIVRSLAALSRLRAAQGRGEDAAAASQQALAVIDRVAASLSDADLRRTLLASTQVTDLRMAAGSSPHPPPTVLVP